MRTALPRRAVLAARFLPRWCRWFLSPLSPCAGSKDASGHCYADVFTAKGCGQQGAGAARALLPHRAVRALVPLVERTLALRQATMTQRRRLGQPARTLILGGKGTRLFYGHASPRFHGTRQSWGALSCQCVRLQSRLNPSGWRMCATVDVVHHGSRLQWAPCSIIWMPKKEERKT